MSFFDEVIANKLLNTDKEFPIIKLDNVAQYYYVNSSKEFWDFEKDFPSALSPFSQAWYEYTPPLISNSEGNIIHFPKEEVPDKCGALVSTSTISDAALAEISAGTHKHLCYLASEMIQGQPITNFPYPVDARRPKFFQISINFFKFNSLIIRLWALAEYLDENGVTIKPARIFQTTHDNKSLKEMSNLNNQIQSVIMLGCSFLHCKNVKRIENPISEKLQKARIRKNKLPLTKYYTLEINPMKEILKREGNVERNGLQKALHICRGHFATYTDEKPLFGKIVGKIWVPSHTRGSKAQGEIKKDYSINL